MSTKIFVNLPVKDLKRSVDFFTKLGYTFNAQFTSENATCMVITDDIYAMLLTEKMFGTFTSKPVADARAGTEVIVALSVGSREEVDRVVETALKTGASPSNAATDEGNMYVRSFQDPDGHLWEYFWMDESAMPHPQ